MSSSLSSLVDDLSQGLHNGKYIDCTSCFEYNSIEWIKAWEKHLMIFKCLECNRNHKNTSGKT